WAPASQSRSHRAREDCVASRRVRWRSPACRRSRASGQRPGPSRWPPGRRVSRRPRETRATGDRWHSHGWSLPQIAWHSVHAVAAGDCSLMSPPLVSIIVNNFNYAAFLRQSVESALVQTHPRTEVIVVDDASTDGSREVIRSFGNGVVPVLQERNG